MIQYRCSDSFLAYWIECTHFFCLSFPRRVWVPWWRGLYLISTLPFSLSHMVQCSSGCTGAFWTPWSWATFVSALNSAFHCFILQTRCLSIRPVLHWKKAIVQSAHVVLVSLSFVLMWMTLVLFMLRVLSHLKRSLTRTVVELIFWEQIISLLRL